MRLWEGPLVSASSSWRVLRLRPREGWTCCGFRRREGLRELVLDSSSRGMALCLPLSGRRAGCPAPDGMEGGEVEVGEVGGSLAERNEVEKGVMEADVRERLVRCRLPSSISSTATVSSSNRVMCCADTELDTLVVLLLE